MKKFKRSFALLCSILLIVTLVEPLTMMASASSAPSITYWAHVQNYGWMSPKNHGTQVPGENDYAGTTAQSLQLECLQIMLNSAISGAVYVQSYIQDIGWTDATRSGCGQAQRTGTEGRGLRMEAIKIWLDGDIASSYAVKYRVYVQNYGWMNWMFDKETAGTTGQSLRIEAIQIYLVEKTPPSITYWAHVQNYGWMSPKNHGMQVPGENDYAGTTGQSLQLECLQILLNGAVSGAVYVQSYIQDIGWTGATASGCGIAQRTGTEGRGLRMEAIKIWLDGDIANSYALKYRVYVQNYGWMNWMSDKETAGTTGQSLRIEAIQIYLVEKTPPSITYWAHVQNYGWMPSKNHGTQVPRDDDYAGTIGQGLQLECLQILLNGSVSGAVYVQSHIQDIGWTSATASGCGIAQRTGTEGQGRRMEAIRLWLDGEVANRYSIEYRVHVQNIGWQNWVRDGATAGMEGQSLRIEAIQIRLVEKSSGTTSISIITSSEINRVATSLSSKQKDALNRINAQYASKLSDSERAGTLIFMFEGCGNDSNVYGGLDGYKATGKKRANAMCVVVKNKKVVFVNKSSSSLPSTFYKSENGGKAVPTLESGIYKFSFYSSDGDLGPRYELKTMSGSAKLPVFRYNRSKKVFESDTSDIIRIHYKGSSTGCQLVSSYTSFLEQVGQTGSSGIYILDRSFSRDYLKNIGYTDEVIEMLVR